MPVVVRLRPDGRANTADGGAHRPGDDGADRGTDDGSADQSALAVLGKRQVKVPRRL
jgi:hypothetical protein